MRVKYKTYMAAKQANGIKPALVPEGVITQYSFQRLSDFPISCCVTRSEDIPMKTPSVWLFPFQGTIFTWVFLGTAVVEFLQRTFGRVEIGTCTRNDKYSLYALLPSSRFLSFISIVWTRSWQKPVCSYLPLRQWVWWMCSVSHYRSASCKLDVFILGGRRRETETWN